MLENYSLATSLSSGGGCGRSAGMTELERKATEEKV